MSWIYYLLEANFYLVIFYLLYYVALRHETWYQMNRTYLLFISAMAFIIPLIQLGFLKPATVYNADILNQATIVNHNWLFSNYLIAVYLFVAATMLVNLGFKIYKLFSLSRNNKIIATASYKLIETTEGGNAFSFFNYLFIDPELELKQVVINHELIHIRQKHSWDIIYLELLKIICWFNPAMYLLQHSIKEIHEFIADHETAATEHNTIAYADFLLNNAYGITGNNLTNTFFNKSLLKKRIIMLHQKRSGKSARLKYLLALPVLAALLCLSTLTFSKDYGWINIAPKTPEIILEPVSTGNPGDITRDKAVNVIKTNPVDTGKKAARPLKLVKLRKSSKLTKQNPDVVSEITIDEPKAVKAPADIKKKIPPPPPPMPPKVSADMAVKIPPPPMPSAKSVDGIGKVPPPPLPKKPKVVNVKLLPPPLPKKPIEDNR